MTLNILEFSDDYLSFVVIGLCLAQLKDIERYVYNLSRNPCILKNTDVIEEYGRGLYKM